MINKKLTTGHSIGLLFDRFVRDPYESISFFLFCLSRLNNDDFYFY